MGASGACDGDGVDVGSQAAGNFDGCLEASTATPSSRGCLGVFKKRKRKRNKYNLYFFFIVLLLLSSPLSETPAMIRAGWLGSG